MYQTELVQVIPTEEYTVYLYYDDGNVRLYDVKPLINTGGIFDELNDFNVFINTCTIMNDTLAWNVAGNYNEWECIDICPDTLLETPIVENVQTEEKRLLAHQ